MQLLGIFVTIHERNGPKFVMFVSIFVISQKWKKAKFSTWKSSSYRVGWGVWVVDGGGGCICYFRPTKPSPSTTLPRIVIVILLMYNQILYDSKQPNVMLWSSSQIWSWLHPYSVGFILRQRAPTVGFIPKYSWLHCPRFPSANISAALAN